MPALRVRVVLILAVSGLACGLPYALPAETDRDDSVDVAVQTDAGVTDSAPDPLAGYCGLCGRARLGARV